MSEISLTPSVEDHVMGVGTSTILYSPHVSEGPGQIAKAPVPSIFVDDRGDIHRLRIGGKRLNLLYSKKDVMRSGYLHPHTTHDFVISGQVEVWTLTDTNTTKTVFGPHQYFSIPPYVPHILYFLQDTSLVEWWDGEDSSFQCWVYHPYRKLVDIQNSLVDRGVGRHHRLVPQDDLMAASSSTKKNSNQTTTAQVGDDDDESPRKSRGGSGGVFWWTVGGILVGAVLGTLLSAIEVDSSSGSSSSSSSNRASTSSAK